MNAEVLKKQHFWILVGLAPLFVLGAVLLVWLDVGDAVSKEKAAYKTAEDSVKGARPKGTKVPADLDQQKLVLADKRGEFWQDNWLRQSKQPILRGPDGKSIYLFDWPRDPDPLQYLRKMEDANQKFGGVDKLKIVENNSEFDIFKKKDVYEAAYDRAAAAIKPTSFPNRDWRSIMRYVSDWTERKSTSDQIWLALEDLWVQRGLLAPVQVVNDAAARFVQEGDANDPLKKVFQNRIWKLEIDVPADKKLVKLKLTNRTDRLQLLGVGNTMRLKVWLSELPNAQPIDLRIEGEFAKAGETLDVRPVARLHGINLPPEEVRTVHRVEQVLDERTVPIRRVDNIVLGAAALSSRQAGATLKNPLFIPEEAPATGTPGTPGVPGTPGAPKLPGVPFPRPGDDDFRPGGPGVPGAAGSPKSGTPLQVLDPNKARYFDISPQVRRMPAAVVLIVDQMFMQDVLVAYANSPLRFQITQYHWRRFRGNLGSTGGSGSGPTGIVDEEGAYTLPVIGSGTPGFPGIPGATSPSSSGVSEGQVTSGLVELTIYGICSLYEKLDAPPAATAGTGDPTPKDASKK